MEVTLRQIATQRARPRSSTALLVLALLLAGGLAFGERTEPEAPATTQVTILFTNDFESAFDPIPAWWRDDVQSLGGVAHLASLIRSEREAAELAFLFDAGDIFTGTLTKLTRGELPFELMISMGYDAMSVGNHEFEYGWEVLREAAQRAPFPVLATNIFYEDTDIPLVQPFAVLEREGLRVGVIGVIGLDAATALIPAHVRGLEFRDPVATVQAAVDRLRDDVDLIVVLAHQGKTAPMQTDAEARPEVQRDIDADLALAGAVRGIDVMLCGHADAGTEQPVVHPQSGTLIMQTYGHGTRLGRLRLTVDRQARRIVAHHGELLLVDSHALPADPVVAAKLARYRARFPEMDAVAGRTSERLSRAYQRESDVGNLTADILRLAAATEVGLMPSGALRGDIPGGEVSLEELTDVFPFRDRIEKLELSGEVLRAAVEQGLGLERGMLQVSGVEVCYDPTRPVGDRALRIQIGGAELDPGATYSVATITMLAQGGDLYRMFTRATRKHEAGPEFAELLRAWFADHQEVEPPPRGRLFAVPDCPRRVPANGDQVD